MICHERFRVAPFDTSEYARRRPALSCCFGTLVLAVAGPVSAAGEAVGVSARANADFPLVGQYADYLGFRTGDGRGTADCSLSGCGDDVSQRTAGAEIGAASFSSIATGELKSFVDARIAPANRASVTASLGTYTDMRDSFRTRGPLISALNPVTMQVQLDGSFSKQTSGSFSRVDLGVSLELNAYREGHRAALDAMVQNGTATFENVSRLMQANWVGGALFLQQGSWSSFTPFSARNYGVPATLGSFDVNRGPQLLDLSFSAPINFEWEVILRSRMNADASGPGTAMGLIDLSNTATVSFTTADGVFFASESGLFPGTSPIPEPRAYALMLLGLMTVSVVVRQKARVQRENSVALSQLTLNPAVAAKR